LQEDLDRFGFGVQHVVEDISRDLLKDSADKEMLSCRIDAIENAADNEMAIDRIMSAMLTQVDEHCRQSNAKLESELQKALTDIKLCANACDQHRERSSALFERLSQELERHPSRDVAFRESLEYLQSRLDTLAAECEVLRQSLDLAPAAAAAAFNDSSELLDAVDRRVSDVMGTFSFAKQDTDDLRIRLFALEETVKGLRTSLDCRVELASAVSANGNSQSARNGETVEEYRSETEKPRMCQTSMERTNMANMELCMELLSPMLSDQSSLATLLNLILVKMNGNEDAVRELCDMWNDEPRSLDLTTCTDDGA